MTFGSPSGLCSEGEPILVEDDDFVSLDDEFFAIGQADNVFPTVVGDDGAEVIAKIRLQQCGASTDDV